MITTWAALVLTGLMNDGINVEFMASGATGKAGGYRPSSAEMGEVLEEVKVAPEGLEAPKYGKLEMGEKSWLFILDEPEEGKARLFVDTNGDGDLTNDPEATWEAKETRGQTSYEGTAQVDLGDNQLGALNLYRFDPQARAATASKLFYYADYGYEVTLTLDGKEYKSFIGGAPTETSRLSVDRDGNGRISSKREVVRVGQPFNYTGTTYVVSLEDGKLGLSKADEELPVAPLPPNLAVGQLALPFTATTMSETEIRFPESYEGKIVMLDFWATWCGPCVAEVPHMKEAYEKWHEHGFEILGISFDQENMEEKVTSFLEEKGLPWSQIYEGKFWNTTLGEMYDVSGIPFVLLVDGTTGEILADARQLRGAKLSEFIGSVIEKRNDKTEEKTEQ